jgi:hypothetical protein
MPGSSACRSWANSRSFHLACKIVQMSILDHATFYGAICYDKNILFLNMDQLLYHIYLELNFFCHLSEIQLYLQSMAIVLPIDEDTG